MTEDTRVPILLSAAGGALTVSTLSLVQELGGPPFVDTPLSGRCSLATRVLSGEAVLATRTEGQWYPTRLPTWQIWQEESIAQAH